MKPKDPNADEGTQAEHPIVRTHPETGRKSLFLSSHTAKIVGMTDEESAPILASCASIRFARNSPAASAGSPARSRSGTTAARSTLRSTTTTASAG